MVEPTKVSEGREELSTADRLHLIQTLNALADIQFDEIIFALKPPKGIIPGKLAAQGNRSTALLDWVESPTGPGLAEMEKVLGMIINIESKSTEKFTAFVISGKINHSTIAEIQAFVQLLRQKTEGNSIDVAFFREGSIKIILSGSPEELGKLQDLVESGELGNIDIYIEETYHVDTDTTDARKARLIQALKLRNKSLDHLLLLRLFHPFRFPYRLLRRFRFFLFGLFLGPDIGLLAALFFLFSPIFAPNLIPKHLQLLSGFSNYFFFGLGVFSGSNNWWFGNWINIFFLVQFLYFFFLEYTLTIELRNADLSGANLKNAYLGGADLSGANLKNAYLGNANLKESNIQYADLRGTSFINADVNKAIFGSNQGLTEADKRNLQQRGAIFQDPPRSDVASLARK